MQKQIVRKTIAKALLATSLLAAPLVSHADEYGWNFNNKNKLTSITFNIEGNKDTLTGKTVDDTILVKMFDVAKNRKSRIVLNPEEIIYGYDEMETKSVFPKDSWGRFIEKGTVADDFAFSKVSKEMLKLSLKMTKKQWGFALTEEGISIQYGKDPSKAMGFEIKGNTATNFIRATDGEKTRVLHTWLKGYDYNWISACCERKGQYVFPHQYLVLAFTNLYPGTPKKYTKLLGAMLTLPENWKVVDMDNFMGMSACDALTPSAYFAVEDASKNRYEILMQGYTYMESDTIRRNVQVFLKDASGLIVEVK
jgi:hypothetical protein